MCNYRCVLNRRIACRNLSNFDSVTSVLIGAHLRRLDCPNIKTLSHAKSHSLQMVYKQNTTRQTLLQCNTANAILGRPKKSHAVAGDVFES